MKAIVFDIGGTLMEYKGMPLTFSTKESDKPSRIKMYISDIDLKLTEYYESIFLYA